MLISSLFVAGAASLNESINNTLTNLLNEAHGNNFSNQPNATVVFEQINETLELNISTIPQNNQNGTTNAENNLSPVNTSLSEEIVIAETAVNETTKPPESVQANLDISPNGSTTENMTALAYSQTLPADIIQPTFRDNSIEVSYLSPLSGKEFKFPLATTVDGKSMEDDPYIPKYLEHYKNFSYVDFEYAQAGQSYKIYLKAGNVKEKIYGYILNDQAYAIHLVGCDRSKKTCNLRINGILISALSGGYIVNINDNYELDINSIKIDYCDNKDVCDYLFDTYDLVEAEIIPVRW